MEPRPRATSSLAAGIEPSLDSKKPRSSHAMPRSRTTSAVKCDFPGRLLRDAAAASGRSSRLQRVEFGSAEDAGRPPRKASARAWAAWIAAATSAGCEAAREPGTWRPLFLSAGAGATIDDSVGAVGIAVGTAASGALAPGSTDNDAGMATGSRPGAASSSSARGMGSGIAAGAAGAAEIAAMRAACIALPSRNWITTAEARAAQQSRTSPSSLPLFLVGATDPCRWGARYPSAEPAARPCGVGAPSGWKAPVAANPGLTPTTPRARGAGAGACRTLILLATGLRTCPGPSSRESVARSRSNAFGDATISGAGDDSPRFVCPPLGGSALIRPRCRIAPAVRSDVLTGGNAAGGSERPRSAPAMGRTSMVAAGCGASSTGSGAQPGNVSRKSVAANGLMRPEPLSLGLASTLNPLVTAVDRGRAKASIVGIPANGHMTKL